MDTFLNPIRKRISYEGFIRLVADTILINLAILVSLAARLLYIVAYGNPQANINYSMIFWEYLRAYGNSAWLLTLICLTLFFLSGFYTYGRFYSGKYKTAIVFQAVTLGYLIFGFLTYITRGALNIPRGALILSWGLSVSLMIASRVWANLWEKVIRKERIEREEAAEREIHQVLVIGGAGYIGSALLPRLLDQGYRVRLVDLLLYGTEPIERWLDHPNLEIMQVDFRQIDKIVEATRGVDAVIHLGGIVGDPACALDEDLTIDINLMATRMIAEVAKGSGVGHFIFASTCSVYGAADHMLDERSALNPVSLYARSKIASEKVLQKMADDHFSPVILRFGTIYGLSGRPRFDLVVNLLSAKAVTEGEITIFGGDQWRPFVHVEDAAKAVALTLEAPQGLVRNQIFNVGSNEQNYSIREIGDLIHHHVPNASIVNMGDDIDRRNYWVNFTKIKRTLGFEPDWTVAQGIDQVIDAITSGRILDYRHAKYSNVKFLTEEGIFRLARYENGWAYQLLNETAEGDKVVVDF